MTDDILELMARLFGQGHFIAGMWVYRFYASTHSREADIVSIPPSGGGDE
jgi:hypothetical protein